MFEYRYTLDACVCVPQCQTRHCMCVCFIKGAQICSLGDYFQWLAASGAAVKWKRSRQPALRAMFPAFERSRHVSRQLTRWVGTLQPLSAACFHPACVSWGTCLPVAFMVTSLPKAGPSLAEPHRSYRPPWAAWPQVPAPLSCGGACLVWMPLSRLRKVEPAPSEDQLRSLNKDRWSVGMCWRTGAGGDGRRGGQGILKSPSQIRNWTEGPRQDQHQISQCPNFPTPLWRSSGSAFWTTRQ